MRKSSASVGLLVLFTASAWASPTTLNVNPAQSNISVQLCMTACGTVCQTDNSAVSGATVASLDCLTNPTEMTLHDFDLVLNETLVLNLNFGFCGAFNSSASGVSLQYGTPGTPMPPAPLGAGGMFSLIGVPATMTGMLNYNATSLVCVAMSGAGYPCSATLDLSQFGLAPIATSGTLLRNGRDLTLTLNVNTSAPIDPNNPGLGNITISGTIVSTGSVPPPDLATFVDVLLGQNTELDAICDSDMNNDGATDGRDISAYVAAVLGP